MDPTSDKDWATRQLLDPSTAPDPASQDGPAGTRFRNTLAPASDKRSASQIAADKKSRASTTARPVGTSYPTPPTSASPSRSKFPDYRDNTFGSTDHLLSPESPRESSEIATSTVPTATASIAGASMTQIRRTSSLAARYPGDKSHRPLDMLRDNAKAVSRHRRNSSRVGADTIDQLDQISTSFSPYHHDGPYDATLLGRNLSPMYSPVAATQTTNEEALRATPREFIADAVQGHRPLMGTAVVPPGQPDRYGRVLTYREGPNLNIEMGWRRWEGIEYHPDDIKGKGEPNFTIDRALKEHRKSAHRRVMSDGGIELTERPRASSNPYSASRRGHLRSASGIDGDNLSGVQEEPYAEWSDAGVRRSHTTGKRTSGMASALKSKFGSIRRRRPAEGRADGDGVAGGEGASGVEASSRH